MIFIMQFWGGLFYLLNKIFLSVAERKNKNKERNFWRTLSWVIYILGVPPWIFLFIQERNWIAASLELSGVPSMILGLVISLKGKGKEPKFLHLIAFIGIVFGLYYSFLDFGGFNTLKQFLEIIMISSFLIGTYQIANEKILGYVWYILMHISCAILMYVDNFPYLILQQALSLFFIVDAYKTRKSLTNS